MSSTKQTSTSSATVVRYHVSDRAIARLDAIALPAFLAVLCALFAALAAYVNAPLTLAGYAFVAGLNASVAIRRAMDAWCGREA